MSTELIINASLPETRIALIEDGEIQELLIERASEKGIVGNIYKGRVTRVLPGMQAAFVDIGLEKAAFLYVDDVYVHSEIWEAEEGESRTSEEGENQEGGQQAGASDEGQQSSSVEQGEGQDRAARSSFEGQGGQGQPLGHHHDEGANRPGDDVQGSEADDGDFDGPEEDEGDFDEDDQDHQNDEDDEDDSPVGMGDEGDGGNPAGTVPPSVSRSESGGDGSGGQAAGPGQGQGAGGGAGASGEGGEGRRRFRRGRRGGRNRRRGRDREPREGGQQPRQMREGQPVAGEALPDSYNDQVSERGDLDSDRTALNANSEARVDGAAVDLGEGRPQSSNPTGRERQAHQGGQQGKSRPEFKESRGRDRRIRSKPASRPVRGQVNIQDLLKEGQEVIVQVAKDPIATKGARLTCHISLPGRHLVCMPTIDHVGVSRRIDRDDERRKLREYVEKYRPKKLGFIVRTATASGKMQSEKRIKQDIDYLTNLWEEIRQKASEVSAPALVYEDLNSTLRAIRDWVNEEIDKIIVDSRYHFNDTQRFVSNFMPSLRQKVELYHGDIPIFDAYGISTELSRALERKVWLKSGGYIVIDQAEALVAVDVNTGRYVGKKNLEDTILKTNLEAVQEIAYQLRLRNCGGIIILDLIDMEKEENKQRVYRALEEALKKDRARPSILKISELGLVEMTRKRTRDTMVRALCESCSHCEGKGFVKSKQTVAYEVMREIERVGIERDVEKILIQAHADVIDILAIEERESIEQLERRYRKQIFLQTVGDYHIEQFEVSCDKKPGAVAARERFGRDRDRGERGRGRGGDRGRGAGDRGRGGDRDRNRDRGDRDQQGRQGQNQNQGQGQGQGEGVGGGAPGENRVQIRLPRANSGANVVPNEPGVSGPVTLVDGQPQVVGPDDDGHFDNEEDRLAFLRAQAAQDEALARTGGVPGGAGSGPRQAGPGAGQNRGDRGERGGRRGRRGRRGGRGRRPERGDGQGQQFSGSREGVAPQGGDLGGSQGGGGDVGGSGGDGGGGDHSTPPVT